MKKVFPLVVILGGAAIGGISVYGYIASQEKEAQTDALLQAINESRPTYTSARFAAESCKLLDGNDLRRVCENNGFHIDPHAPLDLWGQPSDDSGIRACLAETFAKELGAQASDKKILEVAQTLHATMEQEDDYPHLGLWVFLREHFKTNP